jgi:hypothetical protein
MLVLVKGIGRRVRSSAPMRKHLLGFVNALRATRLIADFLVLRVWMLCIKARL